MIDLDQIGKRQQETPCKRKPDRSNVNGSGGKKGKREAARRYWQKEERRDTILDNDAKEKGPQVLGKAEVRKGPTPFILLGVLVYIEQCMCACV